MSNPGQNVYIGECIRPEKCFHHFCHNVKYANCYILMLYFITT